jgi:hypothetical protein
LLVDLRFAVKLGVDRHVEVERSDTKHDKLLATRDRNMNILSMTSQMLPQRAKRL